MRLNAIAAPILFSALVVACAPVGPGDQVTRSGGESAAAGVSLPAMQALPSPVPAGIPQSNSELANLFLRLNFQLESGRSLNHMTRFEGPITVAMTGDIPAAAGTELSQILARFQSEAGISVGPAASAEAAAISVNFVPKAEMKRLVPSAACFVVPGVASLDDYRAQRGSAALDWAQIAVRTRVAVFLPAETSPQEMRDCLNEELAQAIGPLNDLYELPSSVFNDDNFQTVLTDFDMLMLRLQYAPELRTGMNAAQVASVLPAILSRENPAGDARQTATATPSPVGFLQTAQQAMGPGSMGGRKSSAEDLVAMAHAQGWTDNRLGFAYFLMGRLTAPANPAKAVEYLTAARQVYATLPDGGIHAAHVDLQLAAIALAAGQDAQALAFADRAMPALSGAQNAAMLASVLLIKAEALDALGRDDEARALRLDSLGWARYGFGSDAELRARQAEIALLASRG